MYKKILLLFIFCLGIHLAIYGEVTLRVNAVNPSQDETKTVPVKVYLPKGIEPEDILDKGDFQVQYDYDKSLYYAYQEVSLTPAQTLTLAITMKDVWKIAEEEIELLKEHVVNIIKVLSDTDYAGQAKPIAQRIFTQLDTIKKQQNDSNVTSENRIGNFEMHSQMMKDIKKDIGILEDLAVEVGGLPGEKMLGENHNENDAIRVDSGTDLKENAEDGQVVKFYMQVANSSEEERKVPIKYYFPKEVKSDYIVSSGDLKVAYDYHKGLHYVFEDNLLFLPNESKSFVIEVKDIWRIPQERIKTLKQHTEKLVDMLKGSEYQKPAMFLGTTIIQNLDKILEIQTKQDKHLEIHIANYRKNLERYDQVRSDIARLERLVIQAGGKPGVTLVTKDVKIKEGGVIPAAGDIYKDLKSGAQDLKITGRNFFYGKAPDKIDSWRIIWVIIIFLGGLSVLFFLLWWLQIKSKKEDYTKLGKDNNQEVK